MASANQNSESGIDWDLEYHLSTFGVAFDDEVPDFYDQANYGYLEDEFSQMALDSNAPEETFHDAQMTLDRLESSSRHDATNSTNNMRPQQTPVLDNRPFIAPAPNFLGSQPQYGPQTVPWTTQTPVPMSSNIRRPLPTQGQGQNTKDGRNATGAGNNENIGQQPVYMNRNPRQRGTGGFDAPGSGPGRENVEYFPPAALVNNRPTIPNNYHQHSSVWPDVQQYQNLDSHHGSARLPSEMSTNQSLMGLARGGVVSPAQNVPNRFTEPTPTARKTPIAKGPMTIKKDHMTIQDKRKRAVASLPDEPGEDAGNVICIAIMLPSNQRIKRRFLKTDSLTVLKSFIWSQKKVPDKFEVSTNYPRRILYCTPSADNPIIQTFEEAGISSNELLYVTPSNSSTS